MHKPFVHIIILNWNKPIDTIECLSSLEKISYTNYGIILIDNNSKDDSEKKILDWLEQSSFSFSKTKLSDNEENVFSLDKSKKVHFILNYENAGFAKGNNIGIKSSLAFGSDLVLLLNNDTEVNVDFLDILVDAKIKNPELDVLTPQIRLFEPNDVLWNCGGKLILGGFWKRYYYPYKNIKYLKEPKHIKTITFITGCALLYNPKELGLLTEDFFFGEEDFEFSLRVRNMNKKMGCVIDSIIYHKVGKSLESVNTIGKRYIHILNRLVNTRKNNYSITWPFLALAILCYNFMGLITSEKLSLRKAFSFSYSLLKEGITLDKVDQNKFIDILYNTEW